MSDFGDIVICYAGCSGPSAENIADESARIFTNRGAAGTINWGREKADTILNPDISNSTNKRVMRELFEENGVPMPRLVDGEVCRFELNRQGIDYPLVGRPDRHTKGRGLWLCNNIDDVRRALRGTRKKKAATHFMEYIADAPHEYRVHIFRGKSIRISEKKFFTDEDGKKDYTTIKPTGPVKHVRKAAKAAVLALGLDFGAVDILANDKECWVLEVNAAPGLGGSMPALWAETFLGWYDGS